MANEQDLAWRTRRADYILGNLRDALWELDTRFVFTYVSPADKQLRGFDAREVVGQSFFALLTDEAQKYVQKATAELTKPDKQGAYATVVLPDVQQLCRDGHSIWTEVTITPVVEKGALTAFVGMTRDITDRKKAEQRLREYTERLEHLDKELKRLSSADKLTRVVYNRDKLDTIFTEELMRAKRYKVNFSLVVFNIDAFKRINDLYGNQKGDDVLADMESVVTNFIRDNDSVFRRGGDEFIVMLPHTAKDQAKIQAERLRQTIEQHQFPVTETITISAGGTEYIDGDTMETMLSRADQALYIAKRGGHNQVTVR